jgi:hypothetical protein
MRWSRCGHNTCSSKFRYCSKVCLAMCATHQTQRLLQHKHRSQQHLTSTGRSQASAVLLRLLLVSLGSYV